MSRVFQENVHGYQFYSHWNGTHSCPQAATTLERFRCGGNAGNLARVYRGSFGYQCRPANRGAVPFSQKSAFYTPIAKTDAAPPGYGSRCVQHLLTPTTQRYRPFGTGGNIKGWQPDSGAGFGYDRRYSHFGHQAEHRGSVQLSKLPGIPS